MNHVPELPACFILHRPLGLFHQDTDYLSAVGQSNTDVEIATHLKQPSLPGAPFSSQ